MARNRAAMTNGGWQTPKSTTPDQDPRAQRGAPFGQRPFQGVPQTAPPAGYPSQSGYPAQNGYPPQHAGEQGFEPQPGYHYPQQQRQPTAPLPDPRQSLSGLGSSQQPQPQPFGTPQLDYPGGYPSTRPPFGGQPAGPAPGQAPQPAAPQRFAAPQSLTPLASSSGNFRQPSPAFGTPSHQPDLGFGGQALQSDPAFAAPGRAADPMAAAAGYDQWDLQGQAQHDPHGYDLGNYMPSPAGGADAGLDPDAGFHADSMHDPLQQQPEWAMSAAGYDDPTHDPAFQTVQHGYEPGHAGALEQAYAEDGAEYEMEEPRRGSWAMRIAGAIVVAIGLGYGLAQGYKLVTGGSSPDASTPVVESDSEPARTKPLDPGGKQFAHTDSKVMGRLGEAPPASDDSGENAADTEQGGTRKVQTLVVGRDGSIRPPEAPAAQAEPGGDAGVSVPGVTMFDGFGGQYPNAVTTTASATPQDTPQQQPAAARQPVVVRPPPAEEPRVITASTTSSSSSSSSSGTEVAALPPPQKPAPTKKTTSSAATAPAADGSNGYVVVLASVPASGGSRLMALKKFADMQQQYGSVLQNKTPDVREANLGQKGIYHRLLVGPPGSRAQASELCGDLKQAGYKDCWVTAY